MSYSTALYAPGKPAPIQARAVPEVAVVLSRLNGSLQEPPIISCHRFHAAAEQYVVDQGQVVAQEDLPSLLTTLGITESLAWHNENLLARGTEALIWYQPAQRRPMLWARGKKTLKMLVPWPALLFVATGRQLRLYALAEDRRPTPNTRLYSAPLGNVDKDGVMCWGSIQHPLCRLDQMPAFEQAVYNTTFTHAAQARVVNLALPTYELQAADHPTVQDILPFWRDLARRRVKSFDKKLLVPTPLTVRKLL